MAPRTYTVTGMSCGGCESTVVDAVSAIDGVTDVGADNEQDRVTVEATADVADDTIVDAIEDAGYEVAG